MIVNEFKGEASDFFSTKLKFSQVTELHFWRISRFPRETGVLKLLLDKSLILEKLFLSPSSSIFSYSLLVLLQLILLVEDKAKGVQVQNFVARIVLGLRKYNHISESIRSLNLLTVKDRLLLNDAVMICPNDLLPKYLANIFVPHSHIHTRTTRSCNLLHIPRCRLSYGQRSFTYRGCKLWNCISNDLKAADSVNSFRRRLAQKLLSGEHLCWV